MSPTPTLNLYLFEGPIVTYLHQSTVGVFSSARTQLDFGLGAKPSIIEENKKKTLIDIVDI
jgi:hypothetical protein